MVVVLATAPNTIRPLMHGLEAARSRSLTTYSPDLKMVGLYVHIPFCHAKCHYCDFATVVGREKDIPDYLDAIVREGRFFQGLSAETLFIGGGTPTVLEPGQINRLFNGLKESFAFSALCEGTVEANPESATTEVLRTYRSHGINRLSLGGQSSDAGLLASLGRLHTWPDLLSAYERARSVGFDNINIDLMFGLPGQTYGQWEDTLKEVSRLSPEHISVYALKVEKGTHLFKKGFEVSDDAEADMYLLASRFLPDAGYGHHEISNFAKPGRESRHNLKYWNNEDVIGLGLSAAGFHNGRRAKNTTQLSTYLEALRLDQRPLTDDGELSAEERLKESVMLALRLKDGVPSEIIDKLSIPMFEQFINGGHAAVVEGRYRLQPTGWLLSNQLFQHLV